MLGRKWKGHMTGEGGIGSKPTLGGRFSFFAGPETQFLRELKQKKECITLDN